MVHRVKTSDSISSQKSEYRDHLRFLIWLIWIKINTRGISDDIAAEISLMHRNVIVIQFCCSSTRNRFQRANQEHVSGTQTSFASPIYMQKCITCRSMCALDSGETRSTQLGSEDRSYQAGSRVASIELHQVPCACLSTLGI